MNLKIFVLHYTKLVERKRSVLKQFEKHNITEYEFIELFDKDDLTVEQKNRFTKSHMMGEEKFMPAIISLYLKHEFVFKEIEDKYDCALIFEDDIILSDNFTKILDNYMDEVPNDYDALFIGSGCGLHIHPKDIIPGKHIYRNVKSKCTDSYIVSKNGAIKLNNFMKNVQSKYKIDLPIDHWLNLAFKETNSNVYWCEPTIVKQGSENNVFKTTLRSK